MRDHDSVGISAELPKWVLIEWFKQVIIYNDE